jgi:hypothetical protein
LEHNGNVLALDGMELNGYQPVNGIDGVTPRYNVKGGVKRDHWGGEKVDHFLGEFGLWFEGFAGAAGA